MLNYLKKLYQKLILEYDQILPVLEKFDNFHWLGSLRYPDKVREYLTEIDVYALITGMDLASLCI